MSVKLLFLYTVLQGPMAWSQVDIGKEAMAMAARGDVRGIENLIAHDRSTTVTALQLVRDSNSPGSQSFNTARKILAKNEDALSFLEIVRDLCFDGGRTYSEALDDIKYVGGSASVRVLQGLLDNSVAPPSDGDLVNLARSQASMAALADLLPNPPARGLELVTAYEASVAKWRAYLTLNRSTQGPARDIYRWQLAVNDPRINSNPNLVLALGRALVPSQIPVVVSASQKTNPSSSELRRAYQWVLARLGSRDPLDALRSQLDSGDFDMVRDAIRGLAYVASPQSLNTLLEFADRRVPEGSLASKQLVLAALQAMAETEALAPAYPRSIDDLGGALSKWHAWRLRNGH